MRHFTQIGSTDVLPLLLQVERHPELWDRHTTRTDREASPHNGVSDIWLRWRPPADVVSAESNNDRFAELQWYPAAALLPAVRPILLDIMHRIGGLALGGALITRIPPGGQVKPHSDAAGWHANYYRTKVYTVLKSNPLVSNWVEGEKYVPKTGEVFSFDNLREHWVSNESDDDRITMMCAIRCD